MTIPSNTDSAEPPPRKRWLKRLLGSTFVALIIAFVGIEIGFISIPYPSDIGRMRTLRADIDRLAEANASSKLLSQKSTWSKKPEENPFTNSWTDLSFKATFNSFQTVKAAAASWLDVLNASAFQTVGVSCYVDGDLQTSWVETMRPDEIKIDGYRTHGKWTLDFSVTITQRNKSHSGSVVVLFAPSHGKAERFPGMLRTRYNAKEWVC
jgi:hypothetical protein